MEPFLWAINRIDSSALQFVFAEMETNYSLNEKSLLTLWCDFTGKQALRSTSGSFAYCHFQLWNIDLDFGFTLGAVQWKFEHYSIHIHLCPGLSIADGTMNPPGFVLITIHNYRASNNDMFSAVRLVSSLTWSFFQEWPVETNIFWLPGKSI